MRTPKIKEKKQIQKGHTQGQVTGLDYRARASDKSARARKRKYRSKHTRKKLPKKHILGPKNEA